MFNKCSLLYKQLAEQMLIERYSLKRLDDRFDNESKIFLYDKDKENNGLKYFCLFNNAYVERLPKKEYSIFINFLNQPENENIENLLKIVAETYHKVLENGEREKFCLCLNSSNNYPTKDTIIFEFKDKKEFDSNGNYIQPNEEKKTIVFENVKIQYEKLVHEKTGDNICLIRI